MRPPWDAVVASLRKTLPVPDGAVLAWSGERWTTGWDPAAELAGRGPADEQSTRLGTALGEAEERLRALRPETPGFEAARLEVCEIAERHEDAVEEALSPVAAGPAVVEALGRVDEAAVARRRGTARELRGRPGSVDDLNTGGRSREGAEGGAGCPLRTVPGGHHGTPGYGAPMAVHSFSLVPAAYVLLLREASEGGAPEVLLQLRRNTGYMDGYWACGAAGHVEPGEPVLETAVRETREELGLEVEERALEPLTAMHRTGDPGGAAIEQRVDFFLVLREWSGEPAVQEPEKNGGLEWFAIDALPELVPPHERVVLGLLAASLEPGGAPVPPITTFGFRGGETIGLYREAREH